MGPAHPMDAIHTLTESVSESSWSVQPLYTQEALEHLHFDRVVHRALVPPMCLRLRTPASSHMVGVLCLLLTNFCKDGCKRTHT